MLRDKKVQSFIDEELLTKDFLCKFAEFNLSEMKIDKFYSKIFNTHFNIYFYDIQRSKDEDKRDPGLIIITVTFNININPIENDDDNINKINAIEANCKLDYHYRSTTAKPESIDKKLVLQFNGPAKDFLDQEPITDFVSFEFIDSDTNNPKNTTFIPDPPMPIDNRLINFNIYQFESQFCSDIKKFLLNNLDILSEVYLTDPGYIIYCKPVSKHLPMSKNRYYKVQLNMTFLSDDEKQNHEDETDIAVTIQIKTMCGVEYYEDVIFKNIQETLKRYASNPNSYFYTKRAKACAKADEEEHSQTNESKEALIGDE